MSDAIERAMAKAARRHPSPFRKPAAEKAKRGRPRRWADTVFNDGAEPATRWQTDTLFAGIALAVLAPRDKAGAILPPSLAWLETRWTILAEIGRLWEALQGAVALGELTERAALDKVRRIAAAICRDKPGAKAAAVRLRALRVRPARPDAAKLRLHLARAIDR